MNRRLLLLLPLSLLASGEDTPQPIFDLLVNAASELSAGNARGFLDLFDKDMPGLDDLRRNVTALVAEAEVQSSVEILRDQGNDSSHSLELDWFLQIKQRHETEGVTRRREVVKCRVEKAGKKWKFVSLEPVGLFAPPPVR